MKRLVLLASLLLLATDRGVAGDDPYGVLFTSPAQRAQLDSRFGGASSDKQAPATADAVHTQAARPLKLNGTLVSNTGKQEVWINGESQLRSGAIQAARIRLLSSDRVQVRSSLSGTAHDMKPGQVLEPHTGSVTEAYARTTAP